MYNVMKEAHRWAKALVEHRPMPYRCAFGAALVMCHAHAKRIAKVLTAGTVRRTLRDFKAGDVVRTHGCNFVLKKKTVNEATGIIEWTTHCLTRAKDSIMPEWLVPDWKVKGHPECLHKMVVV